MPKLGGIAKGILLVEMLTKFYVTGLGAGLAKRGPGTVGTLVGIPVVIALSGLPFFPRFALVTAVWLVSVPLCTYASKLYGAKDPQMIVIDEIAAFPWVFLGVSLSFFSVVAGFCWFRFFDITKPWPCGPLERLPGGWGVMADDLIAAFYAAIALWITMWIAGRISAEFLAANH